MISELLKRDLSTVARRMKQLRARRGASYAGRSHSLLAMAEKSFALLSTADMVKKKALKL